jgi:hypothetical protein
VHSILGPKAPVRSRDEADFTEQFAQDNARLERLTGIPVEPFGYLSAVEQAHHIVAQGLNDVFSVRSRAILEELGIELHEAVNGARLPIGFHQGAGLHKAKWTEQTWLRIEAARKGGATAVRNELAKMGQELEKAGKKVMCIGSRIARESC